MPDSIYVKWAEKVLDYYLNKSILIDPEDEFKSLENERAGCFVTLHKKNGELRGCIGTFLPTKDNLALEIRSNAISAAVRDPRFQPVSYEEFKNSILLSVDILSTPELVKDYDDEIDYSMLDPKKYGIIVEDFSRWRRGLLLPDLEGVNDIDYQITIAKSKAGIYGDERIRIYRFTSTRYF
jgi:hypothetical protein